MHKKVRIRNSKYKTTNFDFRVVKYLIIAVLFSLMSVYLVYLTIQFGFDVINSSMGGFGFVFTIGIIILTIIFWVVTFQNYNSVKLYNILTDIGQISVQYLEFNNEGIEVCESSRKFKIEYGNIKSFEFFINALVRYEKYYLESLNLHIVYSSKDGVKDIAIMQEPSLMVIDQIYDILYFAQKCPNFSLKFKDETEMLKTTLGKGISSYLNHSCHHTFSSYMQTSKGVFLFFVGFMFLTLVIFVSQFI